jgi:hypothetical protein
MAPVAAWSAHEADGLQYGWKLPKQAVDSATPLAEEWNIGGGAPNGALANGTLTGAKSIKRIGAPEVTWREPDEHGERNGAVLTLPASATEQPESASRRFAASLAALRALRSDRSPAGWSEAAATLKRDAVRLRRSHYGRHASVLLALADALTFTEPADPTLDARAPAALDHGLSLLAEPHITEPAEEAFLVDLLSHGWNLTPSVGEERPEV